MPKKHKNESLRVSGNVLDYYMKYGRERELEKFMRFQSDSAPTSASSNEEWTKDGNLNYLFHERISSMHSHEKETRSQSMPIISSTSSEQTSEHKEHIIPIQLEDDVENTSGEILSTSNTPPQKTPPRQHTDPSKKTQTPESVVKVHKRLEWDSLADVGYKKSKSTGNISKVERMVLKELFEVTTKAANSSENDIRYLEQEIADLQILKKHFTKPPPEYDETKYGTPPLASSTQLETEPGSSQSKTKKTSQGTNTTAVLSQKFEKYAQTSIREPETKPPLVKSTSIGINTSTLVQKNEKYAQTTFKSPDMMSQEVQVTLTSTASSYLGSSAEPSSFEYQSRHSANLSADKTPTNRSIAGESKPSKPATIKNLNNIEPRKALGTRNTDDKANNLNEESNEIKRLYYTWQSILDEDKENSSSSSCTTNTSSAPAIELGIQLICAIMKAKTLSSKQKNKLIKNIVKRITKIANSRELHDIVSRTSLLYGNEEQQNVRNEKSDKSSNSSENSRVQKTTEPPPVPKHRQPLPKDLPASNSQIVQQPSKEVTSESSYIKEVRKELRTAFQDDEPEESAVKSLHSLHEHDEDNSQIEMPTTFTKDIFKETVKKIIRSTKVEEKMQKSESEQTIKPVPVSNQEENIVVEEFFAPSEREPEAPQNEVPDPATISPSTLMKTEREQLKDLARQQFKEAKEKQTQRMKNHQNPPKDGLTRQDSLLKLQTKELQQAQGSSEKAEIIPLTPHVENRFVVVTEKEKFQLQPQTNLTQVSSKSKAKHLNTKKDTQPRRVQKKVKRVDESPITLLHSPKKFPTKPAIGQKLTHSTAVQTQNQSSKKNLKTQQTEVQAQKKTKRKLQNKKEKHQMETDTFFYQEGVKTGKRISSGCVKYQQTGKNFPDIDMTSSKQITEVQFQTTSSSTISTATSTTTSVEHHKAVQVFLSTARDGNVVSSKTSKVPTRGSSSSTMTSTLSTISSTSKELNTQKKTSKTKNNVNMQEWLEPMTQTELDAEKKKQSNKIQNKPSRSTIPDKMDECRDIQLNWIENEIQRLKSLRECLLNDSSTTSSSSEDELEAETQNQKQQPKKSEERPSISTQTSEKLYDTVFSDKSKSDVSIRSKKVTISPEVTVKPSETKKSESQQQQRSKIDTPSTISDSNESVESLLSRRKQKLLNIYQPQSKQYCCVGQIYNDGPSTSAAAAAAATCGAPRPYICQGYGQYSMPHTMQRTVPSSYYTYPPSQTQIPMQPQYYTEPCIYPTVQPQQPTVQATCKPIIQCTQQQQVRCGRQSVSTAFRGSSELTVPMGSYVSSSEPTTTHQYDEVVAAAAAAAALRHNTNVASQTGPSLQRSRPIYETRRCSPIHPSTGNVMSYATYMPSCGQVAANTVCVQAQPRATAYAVQFVVNRNQSDSSSQSTSSATSSTSEELRILAAQAGPSLQLALQQRRPQFVQNAKERKSVINRIQKMRQEREKKLREIADENLSATALDKKLQDLPPPATEQVRLFSTKEMKALTKKRVSKLTEVVHGQDRQKDERKKRSNRLIREVYNRRLQENVRKGKLDIQHSHTLI